MPDNENMQELISLTQTITRIDERTVHMSLQLSRLEKGLDDHKDATKEELDKLRNETRCEIEGIKSSLNKGRIIAAAIGGACAVGGSEVLKLLSKSLLTGI
jgi:hypothetical protein